MTRTFQSEAKRLIRKCGLGEPTAAQLGHALVWVLFASGHLGSAVDAGTGRRGGNGHSMVARMDPAPTEPSPCYRACFDYRLRISRTYAMKRLLRQCLA